MSSQLRHASTIGKKLVKQQHLPHMSSQYGEVRPTSSWDPLASLGHPSKFQRSWQHYCMALPLSGRLPNFAALNRGRHPYSAGRPSRWALAHISSLMMFESFGFCECVYYQIPVNIRLREIIDVTILHFHTAQCLCLHIYKYVSKLG